MGLETLENYKYGDVILNRTRKYLNPVLKEYGAEFVDIIRGIRHVASGISDSLLEDTLSIKYEHHLFSLYDANYDREKFYDVLTHIRQHAAYQLDYPFDHAKYGGLHMIILKIPEKHKKAIEMFKQSKYSKMYSKTDAGRLFIKKTTAYKAIVQDKEYRVFFEEEINNLSKHPHPSTYIHLPNNAELDYLIKPKEEIFNHDKGN